MKSLSNSQPNHRPHKRWVAWASLVLLSGAAAASVFVSVSLRAHSDSRRQVMDELTQLETLATAQSSLVWRALTLTMAAERMSFVRVRGEEQRARGEILQRIDALKTLEAMGETWNSRLGFETDPDLMQGLEDRAGSFLGSVQGAMSLMSMSVDRLRQRLKFWDMNFGPFQEALARVKERDETIATASTRAANQATGIAALITLLAAALLVFRLGRLKAKRIRDLQAEHLSTLATSEARFRQLVQHSLDIILVLEPNGSLRYATPSATILAKTVEGFAPTGSEKDPSGELARESEGDSSKEKMLHAAKAIQAAVDSGSMGVDDERNRGPQCAIEQLMGLSVGEFLANENTEIVLNHGGRRRVLDVHAVDLSSNEDIGGIVLNARDITQRKSLEESLRFQALHDPLTDLGNRRQFKVRFDAMTQEERKLAQVLFIDLDGFKLVNDSYGHQAGDQMLVSTAVRLGTCLGPNEVLARQGGDEFLVLMQGDGLEIARKMQAVLAPPFVFDRQEVFLSASVGVVSDVSECSADEAAQRADIAMYVAKDTGKNQAVVFDESMLGGASERLQLESDFRRALERHEFTVVYQPKVGLKSGKTESLEALVRWNHPTRGFVGPDSFIPFAEESGLIAELGRRVLERACKDAVRWQDQGVVVAVNLSPVQFRNPNLIQEVKDALHDSGLNPENLELEITESAVLGDVQKTIDMLAELKSLGIRLAIDDFGTGYSNLSHIKHFNVDVLKIDQSFVRGGNPSAQDHLSDGAIVEAVIGMAKAFDLHVVAEGVETESHAAQLLALGADLGQGYFFSKPVSGEAIDVILANEAMETAEEESQGRKEAA